MVSGGTELVIRRIATLTVTIERIEEKWAGRWERNADIDAAEIDLYQRTSNTLRRHLETVGLDRAPRDVTPSPEAYLANLAALPPAELLKLGKGYIWGTALRRQTSKPFFIDKMPNNWLHLGLILTILPKAASSTPAGIQWRAAFELRQHFASGLRFSYVLADIGSFMPTVRMMDHFDRVAPGG
jgi:hypothetical protein